MMNQILPIALVLMTTAALALQPHHRMRHAYIKAHNKQHNP